MNGKSQVVLYWGLGLIIMSGVARGEWASLYQDISHGYGSAPPGLMWRVIGEGVFLAILVGMSQLSDDGGTAALYLEAALTIVFLFSQQQTVNQILSAFVSGTVGSSGTGGVLSPRHTGKKGVS